MDLISLLTIAVAFFIVAVTPGPANISNATIAMSKGRKTSLIYGAGLSSGLVFWGVVAASGLGVVLQSSLYLLMTLKFLGGLYLIWLAYLSAKASMQIPENYIQTVETAIDNKTWFFRGLILNISNPKSVIAWMAALSIGMGSEDDFYSVFLGFIVCVVVGFMTNTMYSVVFSFKGVMNTYQKAHRWINGVVSGLFAIAGVGLIRSAYNQSATP